MSIELRAGSKFAKYALRQELVNVRWTKENSLRLFSILERAGYLEVRGKTVYIKRNLVLH
jgi:hypothetical protein